MLSSFLPEMIRETGHNDDHVANREGLQNSEFRTSSPLVVAHDCSSQIPSTCVWSCGLCSFPFAEALPLALRKLLGVEWYIERILSLLHYHDSFLFWQRHGR